MLTRADKTIRDGLAVLEDIQSLGLRHLGFKDVGIEPAALDALHRAMKTAGATTYLEVVSTTPEQCLQSARVGRELGVDYLLGGTQIDEVMKIVAGSSTKYMPFPGRPFGHPTSLGGTVESVEADCRRFAEKGAAGVDLLAYRATEADPLELVKAARRGTPGTLLVAGAVKNAEQIRALQAAGADAFTVGSAVFDGSFAPNVGSLRSQLRAVLDACS